MKDLAEDNLTYKMPLTCCHDLKTKTALQVPCRSPMKQRPYGSAKRKKVVLNKMSSDTVY
jgi:hypothetical protein